MKIYDDTHEMFRASIASFIDTELRPHAEVGDRRQRRTVLP
jgi:hypothetical protein